MSDDTTRRRVLRGTLSLAGVTALAGCTGGGGDDGDDDTPEPTEEPTASPTEAATATSTPTASGGSNADHTVVVGPSGSLVFDPAELSVAPGDTVEFSWDSNFHSVTVESKPSGSDWTGTGEETHDSGFTHTHTFEVEGTYAYYCNPHRGSGMVGSITVGDGGGGSTSTDGGGGNDPY